MTTHIQSFFDPQTATFTYIVSEVATSKAVIIDSVLGYDPYSGRTNTSLAEKVIEYVEKNKLKVEWILETHIHADHLTASQYLKEKLGGRIAIGSGILTVLKYWVPLFNSEHDTPLDASQFDDLLFDNDILKLGNIDIKVLHTPGHTPACVSYLIEDSLFVGDTIFMPDIGTARTDFPGGNAETLYHSIQNLYTLPDKFHVFVGHDYPPQNRDVSCVCTLQEQKEKNILINKDISKENFIALRQKRDENKSVPRLLWPSLQFNLRAGSFGKPENNGIHYIKIPINKI